MKKYLLSLLLVLMGIVGAQAQNLEMTYPQDGTQVTELPDQIIFMFDTEITAVGEAGVQLGYNEPVMLDADKVSIVEGNCVYLDISDIKSQAEPGQIAAYLFLPGVEDYYSTVFTYGAEFGIDTFSFDSKGGKIYFNQNIDFCDYSGSAEIEVVDVMAEHVTTATIEYDDLEYNLLNVTFADELAPGDYQLVIPNNVIMSITEEVYPGLFLGFTIGDASSDVATLVSVTPEAGSQVDIDTEYVFTFSKPISITYYLSSITVGNEEFYSGNGASFDMSDDGKVITARLNKATLSGYGIDTTEDLISMAGTKVTVGLWGVCDAATGEALEYNDPEYDQISYSYRLGDPVLTTSPEDGETVSEIEDIYISCPEGIALANGEKNILVMKNKEQILSVAAADLEPFSYGFGFGDDEGEASVAAYILHFEETLTDEATYEVYIPEGTFTLGGETLNQTTIVTITIGQETASYQITPEEGTVTSLKDFRLAFGGQAIVPSYNEGCDLTITNEMGEVVATIAQDDIQPSSDYYEYDEEYNPTALYFSLDEEITATGVYTLNIPAQAFYVTSAFDNGEAAQFTWTVSAPAEINIVADPADGSTVEKISKIVLTFDGAFTADYDANMTSPVTITNDATGESAASMVTLSWGTDLNQLQVECTPITEAGDYTVTIAAGAAIIDNVAADEIVLHYTIEAGEEPAETWEKTGYVMPIEDWGTDYFWTDACAQEVTVSGTVGSNVVEISQDSYGYHNVITVTANEDESCASILYNGNAQPGWDYFDFGSSYSQYMNLGYCYANADPENGYVVLYGWFDGSDYCYYVDIEWYEGAKEDAENWKNIATGIKNVEVGENAVRYNVAGQRVNANAKGIQIINGRKYLNK